MSKTPQYHIRWSIRRDMPEILDIEADSFEFPWTEKDFIAALRQRNAIGMVAEYDDRVVGFMIYELNKTRIQVLNFATSADFRRQGVGTALIDKLKSKLSPDRRTRITLEVRETNDDAIRFWQSMDFRAVKVLHEFYRDCQEDAYQFVYKLDVTKNRISHLFRKRSAT